MKSFLILLVLTSVLSLANGYKVTCSKTYSVKKNDTCYKIAAQNEISYSYFKTLNPAIDCKNLAVGSSVCLKGKPDFSKGEKVKNPKRLTPPDVTIDNYDSKKIDDISKVLSIKKSKAKALYESFNEGLSFFEDAFIKSIDNKYSVEQCKDMCHTAQSKFNAYSKNTSGFDLKKYNQYLTKKKEETIQSEDLLYSCISQCYLIKEMNDYKKNKIDDHSKKEKRANQPCNNPNTVNINEQTNYLYSYSKFIVTSGQVAINDMDGCSVPFLTEYYNEEDRGTFVPACNSHDLCYKCQSGPLGGGKSSCDSQFLTNMKNVCKIVEDNGFGCNLLAYGFYAAVSCFGGSSYDGYVDNEIRPTCAYCGAYPLREKLFRMPFYV